MGTACSGPGHQLQALALLLLLLLLLVVVVMLVLLHSTSRWLPHSS
jgi:hypothetical protein